LRGRRPDVVGICGWILEATGSWAALFIAALAGRVAGIILLFDLPEPREK
jgi:hypothetical protein